MCVIIHKPARVVIDPEILELCHLDNPHGFGMMWYDGSRVRSYKGMIGHKRICKVVKSFKNAEVVLHFRWATHGDKNKENCHPFVHNGWGMMHNGVLSQVRIGNPKHSDTRAYALQLSVLDERHIRQGLPVIENHVGTCNKLAFLWSDGSVDRIGDWDYSYDCWFSNLSWEWGYHRGVERDPTITESARKWWKRVWEPEISQWRDDYDVYLRRDEV